MKDSLNMNKSWEKHRVAYMAVSTVIVILIIVGVGLVYSAKDNSSQNEEAEIVQDDNLDNSDSYDQNTTMDEELQKIDTEIENNRTDDSGNASGIDTNLGL